MSHHLSHLMKITVQHKLLDIISHINSWFIYEHGIYTCHLDSIESVTKKLSPMLLIYYIALIRPFHGKYNKYDILVAYRYPPTE